MIQSISNTNIIVVQNPTMAWLSLWESPNNFVSEEHKQVATINKNFSKIEASNQ